MEDYKQGFINGWSSALGNLGEALNRLERMVPDVKEGDLRKADHERLQQAYHRGRQDVLMGRNPRHESFMSDVHPEQQNVRVDEIAPIQGDAADLEATLRGYGVRLGNLERVHDARRAENEKKLQDLAHRTHNTEASCGTLNAMLQELNARVDRHTACAVGSVSFGRRDPNGV